MNEGKYGIKAYGEWEFFNTEEEYHEYLMDWIANTDGAEQERAVDALVALRSGHNTYDSDMH